MNSVSSLEMSASCNSRTNLSNCCRASGLSLVKCSIVCYTRKNAQVVTSLLTRFLQVCLRLLVKRLEQAVKSLMRLSD